MELKNFCNYTEAEKKELLLHWWHYYGKMIYSLEEMEEFSKMIDENSNQVMMMAIIGYVNGFTSQRIIRAMRENKLEKFKATTPVLLEQDDEFIDFYYLNETMLLMELVKTYNNPEPDIPVNPEAIAAAVAEMVMKKEIK